MKIGASIFYSQNDPFEIFLDRLRTHYKGLPLQLGFWGTGVVDFAIKNNLKDRLRENSNRVISVHSPNIEDWQFYDMIKKCADFIDEEEKIVTLHPGKKPIELRSIQGWNIWLANEKISVGYENFPYRSKKWLRTPMDICNLCYRFQNFKFTMDTSHVDEEFYFSRKFLKYALPYIQVIHISNKISRESIRKKDCYSPEHFLLISDLLKSSSHSGQHRPLGKGELNLQKFVNELKFLGYQGQVILELMPCYDDVIQKQYELLVSWAK